MSKSIPSPSPTPTQSAEPSLRTSALQTKITSILSSSYSDTDIRSALATLEARTQTTNITTASLRHNLRLDALREQIACDAEIINDFGSVAAQLRQIGTLINQLKASTGQIRQHVTAARLETAPVNDETEHLSRSSDTLQRKKVLLDALQRHFVLSDDEVSVLTGSTTLPLTAAPSKRGTLDHEKTDRPNSDVFFTTLVKAKRIHTDSRILLSFPSQRLGTDILSKSSATLSQAYSKLHRSILRDFKTLDLENPSLSTNLRRGLRVLAERPALFTNALDQFSDGRESLLSEGFYAALTGQGGNARPIEASGSEPLRYVGDMLAWAHGAAVGEREALEGLFIAGEEEINRGIREGLESEPWMKVGFGEEGKDGADDEKSNEGFNGEETLRRLVNRNLRGVGKVLKSRMEVLIKGDDDAAMTYKIASLVRFYGGVFKRVLGQDAEFMETLAQIEEMGVEQFKTSMRYHVTNLKSDNLTVAEDVGTPEFLGDSLEELKELLQSYDTSVQATDKDQAGLRMLLAEALDSVLGVCHQLSKTSLEAPRSQVFAINCLLAARKTLSNFPFTRAKAQALQESIAALSSELTDFQLEFMLRESSLAPLVSVVDALPEDENILTDPAARRLFSGQALTAASQDLDEFLPSALVDAMENVKGLQNSALAHQVTNDAASAFCEAFERLTEQIEIADEADTARKEGMPGLKDHFPRTSEEIRILLS